MASAGRRQRWRKIGVHLLLVPFLLFALFPFYHMALTSLKTDRELYDRKAVPLVIRQGVMLTGTGIVLGLAAGAAGSQVLRSLLFGISTLDPLAFGGAALLLGLVALGASYLPARRATRVDPMVALRAE